MMVGNKQGNDVPADIIALQITFQPPHVYLLPQQQSNYWQSLSNSDKPLLLNAIRHIAA
jgi:hypothetical protein